MSDPIWLPGIPKIDGLYWFDNGLERYFPSDKTLPVILSIKGASQYVHGSGGAMPLNMVYDTRVCHRAKHMMIAMPSTWTPIEALDPSHFGSHARMWIRDDAGRMGVGILKSWLSNGDRHGNILWLDGCSESGRVLKKTFLGSPIKVPRFSDSSLKVEV